MGKLKMNTQYHEVPADENNSNRKITRGAILKQLLICSSAWTQYFVAGLCKGAPTVFIPQIRKQANSTDIIDDELSSWLYSTSSISLLPWVVILPLVTKHFGRKLPQILTFVDCMVFFIILYCSQTPQHILISQVLQGYLHAVNFTIGNLIVTEFSSTKLRGMFLTIQTAGFFWGIWASNAIGTFFHWKYIAVLGLLCSIFMATVFFCPESPSWLASRGRFEDCRTAYRWIHGFSAEKDLQELIVSQQNNIKLEKEVNWSLKANLRCPELYKPLILSVLAVVQYVFSGKIVCSLFILDIFKNITSSEKSAYGAMLILDGVTVFSMYVGSYLSRILKRRTLYMTSSVIGVIFLFLISLYLFLIRVKILPPNDYASLTLFTLYSLAISCGSLILALPTYGEIISRRFQTSCYMIIALTFTLSYSGLLKFAPKMFANLGIDGTFLLFAITCGICTLYLYLFLPETKNKTQWEIEEFFKDKKIEGDPVKMSQTSPCLSDRE